MILIKKERILKSEIFFYKEVESGCNSGVMIYFNRPHPQSSTFWYVDEADRDAIVAKLDILLVNNIL